MEALLYFAFWAVLIFLMMRLGCGAHIMGHRSGKGHGHESPREGAEPGPPGGELRWVPPEQDVDPVCGEAVATANAKPSLFDGVVYYFCSPKCRESFEAAPERYVPGAGRPQGNEETGHV